MWYICLNCSAILSVHNLKTCHRAG